MLTSVNPKQYNVLVEKLDSLHKDFDNVRIDIAIIKSDVNQTKEHAIKTNGRVTRMEDQTSVLAIEQAKQTISMDNHVKDDEQHQNRVESYFFWFVTSIVGTFGLLLYNTVMKSL